MTDPPADLRTHVAVVTGANHGIGGAVAETLAGCGASVVLGYLRTDAAPAPANAVVDRIERDGGNATALEADLTDDAAPAALFDMAEARFGPVDILVNNASAWTSDSFAGDDGADRFGRPLGDVSVTTYGRVFASTPVRRH
jgi:3-oxoacyl-[acyl-carrier protein] reductase